TDTTQSSNWLLKEKYNDRNVNCVYFFGSFNACEINAVRGIRPVTYIDLSKANKYTITYKNNGKILKTDEYEAGETINAYTPEIEGYAFNGWDTEIPSVMPAHSIEANAQTQINSYKLTLDANGGLFADNTALKESQIIYNTPLILEEPNRKGYSFNNWGDVPEKMPAHDLSLSASWNERTDTPYKITTYKENLNGEYTSQTVTEFGQTNAPISTVPGEYEGYEFDADRSVLSGSISADGTAELKLYYNLKTYEVTFNFNYDTENIAQIYKHGQSINPPSIPSRTGYAGKWDKDIPDICTASETYNVTWQENSYQISFNTNGGNNINNAVYTYGSPVTKPADPVKEGYTFIGWDNDFPETMPAENLEFTALWQVNTYTIRWIADNEIKEEAIPYGESIKEPIVIVNDGYTFTGWDKQIPSVMPAEDLEFTAQFTPSEYSVTWIAGESVLKKEIYKYGDAIIEPVAPDQTGYTFAWNNYPNTMPAKDISITGTYTEIPAPIVKPQIDIINYKNTITVDYKTTITFRAKVTNPAGNPIQWYVNNELKGSGETFTVNQATETFNISCSTNDSAGEKVSSRTELVKVKTDFWSRIVAFFRMLFRRLPVITQ
ncbi:MAG: InlB B-repeat-containing protein, partial [Clostridia bacterium]|nr:InlB B-repeat-containing protein [Clostridia bacterium]